MSGIRFTGLTGKGLAALLREADEEGRRAAFATMREETATIMKISQDQAPYEDGQLEAAHKLVIRRNQSLKATYAIEVGGIVSGVNVDEYCEIIHEGIGWSKLGEESIAKQGRVAPLIVGTHFLTRAFDDRIAITIKRIQDAMTRGVLHRVG